MTYTGTFTVGGTVYKTASGNTGKATRRGVVGTLLHALGWALRKAADAVQDLEERYVEARPEIIETIIDVTTDLEVGAEDLLIAFGGWAAKAAVAVCQALVAVVMAAIYLAAKIPGVAMAICQGAAEYFQGAWAFRSELVAEACAA